MSHGTSLDELFNSRDFIGRHIGPNADQTRAMLDAMGLDSIDQLIDLTVPASIRGEETRALAAPVNEQQALAELKNIAGNNQRFKSYIGMGYHPTYVPPVILRNVLENPGWYTAYTPYQPEIAQGRLEGLLNFQQMIIELTGMDMANASMLDEATAAAEAMAMAKRVARKNKSNTFFADKHCHPQTLAVLQTRASHFGFELVIGDITQDLNKQEVFGAITQYPGTSGEVKDLRPIVNQAHEQDALLIVAADILSLVLLESPGAMGADIVVGSNQRFGIPMGFGGPHAAFFGFREKYKRATPGRIIGVSVDTRGKRALRMAMQTREQHIRREKANSNICTSQVLLAVMSVFYAMYHGSAGVTRIAQRVHTLTKMLAQGLTAQGHKLAFDNYFDTLCVIVNDQQQGLFDRAQQAGVNLRKLDKNALTISLNECTSLEDIHQLLDIFSLGKHSQDVKSLETKALAAEVIPASCRREGPALNHPVFEQYHSETEMLRYLKRLESKDIALNHAMIPLGSCTMKLNATAEMIPVTWPEFGELHPFAPMEQAAGYSTLFTQLQDMLKACTGYDAISLQPNAGSQGEYAGLVAIRKYFEHLGQTERNICLIPASAHGTNPASAQMVEMKVVVVACDNLGNVDLNDLKAKVAQYGETIAALMVTYPSTHGVFEEEITAICDLIHSVGAQVYIDGANMNALVGLAAPGKFGGDVSHLNLHKTFCIPHGGGGPGMGPIGVKSHLAPFLAGHPVQPVPNTLVENGTISAAPWGSASILTISWMYIRMMGAEGMKRATEFAILNANYIAHRLQDHYPILYKGKNGYIAHECLLDLRPLKESSGITEEDIAKRLMDFGFHAPTMSFPVAGTLMIEPTESESQAELDRFCDAMIKIRQEASLVESGELPRDNNPLVNAPHTLDDALDETWTRPYTRDEATRPLPYLHAHKIWPTVNRIDNVYGDRNLICSCPSIESYTEE
ncbi:aminomethyl-transferring glycine dehydrogenase [Saccharophagus degradans]|uniref:Glycine dehydrogenase (decarboxylating) n=1 Tax=Saccharophagus degradans (strain 2-40 / ATCC 43961 / DSM 17024) TaxID=203122 RepID=GCSP_SACD2|nr:aminomethyl-transferring glycine dehydrogenase [Saccharophagus degradans]Q21HU3.1 RecName: Full=Glycine dehydrogenase (decarboxylating); AltName: Full=Glycine cleavage system P-protein; AltName: Full=Glycine decarboxylase; AltName: Full=Glycine dehydrogenase (aminomethyl-transferring) [Saccharophagus degradans 2-40]ABD81736.1 glycine dehydrogenase (decarboxylating) alpha subunit / glycine dehydrogenase (decarboxylating) beta subunit [Saccharophagus degradans 2-40]